MSEAEKWLEDLGNKITRSAHDLADMLDSGLACVFSDEDHKYYATINRVLKNKSEEK